MPTKVAIALLLNVLKHQIFQGLQRLCTLDAKYSSTFETAIYTSS
ncbi:hypothetical protein [Nostoc sp. MG11]|nr:hypothetical protein [Nostoc sp. MG11]